MHISTEQLPKATGLNTEIAGMLKDSGRYNH